MQGNLASSPTLQGNQSLDELKCPQRQKSTRLVQYQASPVEEEQQDLLWWVSLDQIVPLQALLLPRVPSMIITSDASTPGWGACWGA